MQQERYRETESTQSTRMAKSAIYTIANSGGCNLVYCVRQRQPRATCFFAHLIQMMLGLIAPSSEIRARQLYPFGHSSSIAVVFLIRDMFVFPRQRRSSVSFQHETALVSKPGRYLIFGLQATPPLLENYIWSLWRATRILTTCHHYIPVFL